MKTFIKPFELLLLHRALIAHAAAAELRYRTAGMSLGMLWLLLAPLLLLLVYSVVYLVIFRVRPTGMTETQYVLYLFCGLVPFLALAEAIMAGQVSLARHPQLLASTVFPIEILPVRAALGSQSGFAAGMLVVLIAALWAGRPGVSWLLLAPLIVLQLLFSLGLAWIVSVANLVFRDLQQIMGLVITILMVLSPIAFTPDMLPGALQPLIWLNPFAYFVLAYQQLLIFGTAPAPAEMLAILAISLAFFVGGHALFVRVKAIVIDYA